MKLVKGTLMAALAAVLCSASVASAGILAGQEGTNLWGTTYGVKHWFVRGDVGAAPNVLEPEGMTFYNGSLYVTGDTDDDGSGLSPTPLVEYTATIDGTLSGPITSTVLDASGSSYGPEGLTVNTSGAGYGGGAGQFVAVESGNDPANNLEKTTGVINLPGGSVTDTDFPSSLANVIDGFDPDDIAYVASTDQFAVVQDPNTIEFHNHTAAGLSPANSWFETSDLSEDAKGLAVISEAFAELLTGEDVIGAEALLVAGEANELAIYQLDGTLVSSVQDAPTLSIGAEIEAVAVDEVNGLIFLGDEGGFTISVIGIEVPEPGTLSLLGLAGLMMLRRRR